MTLDRSFPPARTIRSADQGAGPVPRFRRGRRRRRPAVRRSPLAGLRGPPPRSGALDRRRAGTVGFGNETYYLETALRLRLPGDESTASATPYEPTRLSGSGQGNSLPDLSPFRVVALCNVAEISPDESRALARFVESGGSLIIFTGDQVKQGAYAALEQARLLPARVQGPAEIGSYRFADWVKDHPILSPFADPQYGDLRTLRFRRITRLLADPDARVLATAPEGVPLLVEKAAGQGRVIVFAFPADNAWGDWAIHRLYVPLVHQLLGYLTNRLPETSPVRFDRAGPGPAQSPGVILNNGSALVRNVDAAESEIERTTVAKLREAYRLPEGTRSVARRGRRGGQSGGHGRTARRAVANCRLGAAGRACRGNVCRQPDLCVIITRIRGLAAARESVPPFAARKELLSRSDRRLFREALYVPRLGFNGAFARSAIYGRDHN